MPVDVLIFPHVVTSPAQLVVLATTQSPHMDTKAEWEED